MIQTLDEDFVMRENGDVYLLFKFLGINKKITINFIIIYLQMTIFIEFLYLDLQAIKTTLFAMGHKVVFIAL